MQEQDNIMAPKRKIIEIQVELILVVSDLKIVNEVSDHDKKADEKMKALKGKQIKITQELWTIQPKLERIEMDVDMLAHNGDENVLKVFFHDIVSGGTKRVLPEEVALMILGKLSLKELGNLRLVHRELNNLIVNHVWKAKNSADVFLYKKTKKYAYMPEEEDCYAFKDQNLARQVLQQRHPNLEKLTVKSIFGREQTPPTPELITGQRNLTDLSLQNLVLSQPFLQALGENLPGLKSIHFRITSFDGNGLALLGRQLEELTLELCIGLKMSLVMDALKVFGTRKQQLTTLKIKKLQEGDAYDFQILTYVLENFPKMKHFHCEQMLISKVKMTKMVATDIEILVLDGLNMPEGGCDVLYPKLFENPLANLTKLHINVDKNNFTPELLKRVAATSPKLENIYLNLPLDFSEYIDTFLVLPSLKFLKIRGVGITTEHVLQLVCRHPFLWHLSLHSVHEEERKKRANIFWTNRENRDLFKKLCEIFAEQKRDRMLELMLPMMAPNAKENKIAKAGLKPQTEGWFIPVDFKQYFRKYFDPNVILNLTSPSMPAGHRF